MSPRKSNTENDMMGEISGEMRVPSMVADAVAYRASYGYHLRGCREERRLRFEHLAEQANGYLVKMAKSTIDEAYLKNVCDAKIVPSLHICEALAQVLVDENPKITDKAAIRSELGEVYKRSSNAMSMQSRNKEEIGAYAQLFTKLVAKTGLSQQVIAEKAQAKLKNLLTPMEQKGWAENKTTFVADIEGGKHLPSVFLMYALMSTLNANKPLGELNGRMLCMRYARQSNSDPIQPVHFKAKGNKETVPPSQPAKG